MRSSIHDGCVTRASRDAGRKGLPEGEGGLTRASLIVVAREKSNDKMIEGARGRRSIVCTRARVVCQKKIEKEKGRVTERRMARYGARRDGGGGGGKKGGAAKSTVAVA